MPSMRRVLVIEVHAFHEKGFCMSVWHLEKYGDGKDIDVLLDVVFVICVIYGSMRDMVVKDSENMKL